MDNNVSVVVWMVCYNQEDYIQKAIESVLFQKTLFPFYLIIGEDNSTDNTRNICIDYANKYPDKIKLILHPQNVGPLNNAQSVYKVCFESNAKYLAFLEGDDYWSDSDKLQKQVDFLEANEQYSVCCHETQIIFQGDNKKPMLFRDFNSNAFKGAYKNNYTVQETFNGIICHTSSYLMRMPKVDFNRFNKTFKKVIFGDHVLFIIGASCGGVYVLDEVMSVYRINDNSITKNITTFTNNRLWMENKLLMYNSLNKYFNYSYSTALESHIKKYETLLFDYYWFRIRSGYKITRYIGFILKNIRITQAFKLLYAKYTRYYKRQNEG